MESIIDLSRALSASCALRLVSGCRARDGLALSGRSNYHPRRCDAGRQVQQSQGLLRDKSRFKAARPDMDPPEPPIHVVLFFTYGVSLRTWSDLGLLSREVRLYRELADRGVRVTFVTYGGPDDLELMRELDPIEVIPLYARCRRPNSRLARIVHSLRLPFSIRDELRGVSVIKTNQVWGGWNAVVANWISGKPLLARIGFNPYVATREPQRSRFYYWALKSVMRLMFRTARRIHVPTQDDREFLETALGIPGDRITVHMNYVDTHRFGPVETDVYSDRIVTVGRLHPEKNLQRVITALSGTGLTFDVIGSGDLRTELERHARACGVPVNFLGTIPHDELPAYVCRYPIFVLCSNREGNPKALLEAMACGRAVVGSDVPGINTLIRHEENGLLCSTDPESIRAAIGRLAHDPLLRERLGRAARRFVEENCSIESYLQHEMTAYRELAGAKCA